MSRKRDEQVLSVSDLRILDLLLKSKEPVKIGEITKYLGKYHQRTKDRVKKLIGVFIKETEKAHSKREKPYEIIESERELIEMMLKKWRISK